MPALSCPAASSLVKDYNGIDMNLKLRSGTWADNENWGDGAYQERDVLQVGRLYINWVKEGNLKKQTK